MSRFLTLSLLFPCSLASAQQAFGNPPAAPNRVEVQGASTNALRRDEVVARLVIGRGDIARHGDSSLAQVLKRQPGISIVGTEVRMRGLGSGYTQILIDGQPAPQGFSIDSIAPELVERIEVARSATADQSTQAVAGSINIVLRKRAAGAGREDKATLGYRRGEWNPSASTRFGGRSGTLSWTTGATLERSTDVDLYQTMEAIDAPGGAPLVLRRIGERAHGRVERLNLAPALNWALPGGDTLGWQTRAEASRIRNGIESRETALLGSPSAYPDSAATMAAHSASLHSDLAWARAVGEAGKLTVKASVDANRRRSDYLFAGRRPDGGAGLARFVAAGADERTANLTGKYLAPLGSAHSLALGWDAGHTTRDERRDQRDTVGGAPGATRFQDYTAQVERLALFAQDEWAISPVLQAYLGLRWEGVRTATEGRDLAEVSGSSGAASPILQLLWKLPEKRQLRLALARTYKAPLTRDLVPRRYTINNDNSAVNPDVEGNPALRPELSWGLDLAWERYVGQDGVASVSAYARRVEDVTTRLLYRDGASWVARPVNGGRARVAGIEFDLKSQGVLGGVPLEWRLNAGRNWSWLEGVPGPDNRLDEQVGFTANAGVDYRGKLWSAGMGLNYQGSDTSLSAAGVRSERGARALLDAYWLRNFGGGWRLRVSAANVFGSDARSAVHYRDAEGATIRRAVDADGVAALRVALERNW